MNPVLRRTLLLLSCFLLGAAVYAQPVPVDVTNYTADFSTIVPAFGHDGSRLAIYSTVMVIEDTSNNGIAPALSNGLPGGDDHVVGYFRIGEGTSFTPDDNGSFYATLTAYPVGIRQPFHPITGRHFYLRAFQTFDTNGVAENSWVPPAGTYYVDGTLADGVLPTIPTVDNNSGGVVTDIIFPDSATTMAGGAHTGRTSGVRLLSPLGGQVFNAGAQLPVSYLAVGLTGSINIELNRDYPNGAWNSIGTALVTDTVFNWTVTAPSAVNARIRITSVAQPTLTDMSTSNFSILATGISLIAPLGGDTLVVGHLDTVRWRASGVEGNVNIEINRSYPSASWEAIATRPATDTLDTFTVFGANSTTARIRIYSTGNQTIGDTSHANFMITSPSITITHPNGDTLMVAIPTLLNWSSQYLPTGNVRIDINRNYPSGTWVTIIATTPNDGVESWIPTGPLTSAARLRITSVVQPAYTTTSAANFTIAAPPMTISAIGDSLGNPVDSLLTGNSTRIRFTANSSMVGSLSIRLNRNYPAGAWTTIIPTAAVTDTMANWTVTEPASRLSRFQVVSSFDTNAQITSAANFTIYHPTVTVTRPNTALIYAVGTTDSITWTTANFRSTDVVRVDLNRSYPNPATWSTIVPSTLASLGVAHWNITGPVSAAARIRVMMLRDTVVADTSDVNFSIVQPSLTITRPNTALALVIGHADSVQWTRSNVTGNVRLDLNRNYPSGTWDSVTTISSDSLVYRYTVGGAVTTGATARYRIASLVDTVAHDTSDVSFSINTPTLAVTHPNVVADTMFVGRNYNITWTSTNIPNASNVRIDINRTYTTTPNTWTALVPITTNSGTYTWTPVTGPTTTGQTARIRIVPLSVDSILATDMSDASVAIVQPSISVTHPNGGETFVDTHPDSVTWTAPYVTGNVTVQINRAYPGAVWTTLGTVAANTGRLLWTVVGPNTATNRIRVVGVTDVIANDTCDASFTITAPTFTVAHPIGGDTCRINIVQDSIRFTNGTGANALLGNVNVQINRNYPTSTTWTTILTNVALPAANAYGYAWARADSSFNDRIQFQSVADTSLHILGASNFVVRHTHIVVNAPNGGEALRIGDSTRVRFHMMDLANLPAADTLQVAINRTYPSNAWTTLFTGVLSSDTSRMWTVSGAAANTLRIRVRLGVDTLASDTSNANFAIGGATLTITSPLGGANLNLGNIAIRWAHTFINDTSRIRVESNLHGGLGIWDTLGTSIAVTDSFIWAMPPTTYTDSARFRISWIPNNSVRDSSRSNIHLVGTSVNDFLMLMPTEFSLKSAYPNPFNNSISFMVGVPHNAEVKLLIYNMLGQHVATVQNGYVTSGYHRFIWNASKMSTGTYIVKMDAPGYTTFRKILYLK